MNAQRYQGRFAPSPTGRLHFGSLTAALASYLDAHEQQGEWRVRMEDLDPPREVTGAADAILRTLEAYGFEWHGEVVYQSQRHEYYHTALEQLWQQGDIYVCDCTRKAILSRCKVGEFGAVYDGFCQTRNLERLPAEQAAYQQSLRMNVARVNTSNTIAFNDRIQGQVEQNLIKDVGDFHLLRRDGLFAYHIAVVVDDAAQGITDIVRGYDLLGSTFRHIHIQQRLNLPTPRYAHLPLALHNDGSKLSKQTLAVPLDDNHPAPSLYQALCFLGQHPPSALQHESLHTIWEWATTHWRSNKIPKSKGQLLPEH